MLESALEGIGVPKLWRPSQIILDASKLGEDVSPASTVPEPDQFA
jgi:hypothetical protein